MFSYRPPKSSIWGHPMRPKNTLQAIRKTHAFFEKYFQRAEPIDLTLYLNSFRNEDPYLQTIQQQAAQLFGPQGLADAMTWMLPPADYPRVIKFILASPQPPKHLADPIRLSFDCNLQWQNAVLPNIDWPQEFLQPENEPYRRSFFGVTLELGGRFSFPMGFTIPISPTAPASYQFLAKFSAEAPFKMSPQHFQVVTQASKNGKLVGRKPDAQVLSYLREAIQSPRPYRAVDRLDSPNT
jgi:hypothetical protein